MEQDLLNLWSRICISRALVPGQSALWWRWLGDTLVWSEASHRVCWFWASWEVLCCKTRSSAVFAQPRASWYELQNDLQMVATYAGLGGFSERLSYKLRLTAAITGLGLLSKSYGHAQARCYLFGDFGEILEMSTV